MYVYIYIHIIYIYDSSVNGPCFSFYSYGLQDVIMKAATFEDVNVEDLRRTMGHKAGA